MIQKDKDLLLFSIGWLCTVIEDNLYKYDKDLSFKQDILKEAKNMIEVYLEMLDQSKPLFIHYKWNIVIELVLKIYPKVPLVGKDSIIYRLKVIKNDLEKIIIGEPNIDITMANVFFKRLEKLCLKKAT